MAAPSAVARDPWRFVVIRKKETLSTIAAALPNGGMLATAPLGIVVCGDLDAAHDRQLSYLLQDCSAAIENLLLGAHGLGLGACWLGVHPREERVRKLQQMLSLPAPVIPVACLAIGRPGEAKEPRTRFNPAFVSLMGLADTLSTPDMQKFTDFVASVKYQPSPNRNADGTMPTSIASRGSSVCSASERSTCTATRTGPTSRRPSPRATRSCCAR